MKIFRGINDQNDGIEGAFWSVCSSHAETYAVNGGYWNARLKWGKVITAIISDGAVVETFHRPDSEDSIQDEALFGFVDSLSGIDAVFLPDWEGVDCYFVINHEVIEIIEEDLIHGDEISEDDLLEGWR